MAQSIGALVAELSANTASFQKDMGKAAAILNSHAAGMNKTLAGIEKGIGRVGTAFAAVITTTAVARFAQGILNVGDEFAKLSQKTGVSVEKLSEFAHGAKLSDVSTQDLADGLRKLAVSMNEAATQGTGQMAATFRALGVSVTDANGNLRDTSDVFEELSARFAQAQDGPEKVAIAVRLLGKSGESLIPLMNGLAQTSEEARRLGLVMSTEAAKNAEAFNDEMSRLAQRLQHAVLPAIVNISKAVRALLGSEDLDILQAKRAKAAQEYSQLIESGMSRNSARVQFLIQQIDELDAKIIEANKRLLTGLGAQGGKPKPLPIIANTGEVERFQALLHELQKATQQAQLAITQDEAAAAYERMAIAREELEFKIKQQGLWIDENKKATAQQIEIRKAFQDWIIAAEQRAAFEARTQLDVMLDDWKKVTKEMQAATANWVDDFANRLTEFVITGKFEFRDFAQSIIRDLIRIQIQKRLAGIIGSLFGGGTTSTGTGAATAAGARADGGPVTGGRPYLVGERGPELFVPSMSGSIVPNESLGGGVNVTIVFNVSTGVAETVRAEMMTLAPVIEERSKQGVLAAIERGGRYSQAVGRKA